ncbi:MAG: N-ethylammeline chlorohydrolase, partial [Planctomycetes bacterium]|nr:N-ethylammeline chlorohydrolase [Planctomycetota bacterium]
GAPANNRLDVLTELRQAALLQQWHSGPGTLSAFDALSLATREGARALGFGEVCGTLEPGKAADLVLMDLNDPRLGPGGDPYTKIVYAADRSHIRDVMVAGRFLDRGLDAEGVAHDAGLALKGVLSRSGL